MNKNRSETHLHQERPVHSLGLLLCHSISRSMDYTSQGHRCENGYRHPVSCHIKCQGIPFRDRDSQRDSSTGGRRKGGYGEGRHGGTLYTRGEEEWRKIRVKNSGREVKVGRVKRQCDVMPVHVLIQFYFSCYMLAESSKI